VLSISWKLSCSQNASWHVTKTGVQLMYNLKSIKIIPAVLLVNRFLTIICVNSFQNVEIIEINVINQIQNKSLFKNLHECKRFFIL
jgi:hypothetical protein